MLSAYEKDSALKSIYGQILVVVIAFLLMGTSSFFFARNIEYRHLVKHVENALALAEIEINDKVLVRVLGGGEEGVLPAEKLSEYVDELNSILNNVVPSNLTSGSYGLIIDSDLAVLVHPEEHFIGRKLYQISSGLSNLSYELFMGRNVYERRVKNFMHKNSIVYFRRIDYGLFLGIVIPVNEYYRSVTNMAAFLIILCSILAWGMCTMMYYISKAKIKSDMRTRQKSNFLATISHEIRTPLNAILGMTEIQMQNTAHSSSAAEAFVKINNSGGLLLNIINDVLDLSKIESGKLEIVPIKYDVANMLNDVIQLNHIRYDSKPIVFLIKIDENIPSTLVGDELHIKQILNNLLSNAFKYTESGEVELSVDAECVGRGGGAVIATLIFRIRDTGLGMSQDQVNHLFDENTRFNLEANRTTVGAGLGMTITQNLIQLMYGKISVKSEINEGTTVVVRLPQKTDGLGIRGVIGSEMAENLRKFKFISAAQLKKSYTTYEYMPYGSVLIVDDVETNLFVAKGLMAPYGLKIDLASDGFEAIDKIKSGKEYDIVFMDHMMPKMDGIETAKLLRGMGYSQPIVALTANALAGHAKMFLSSGFDDFIPKPIDIRRLNIILNRLIRDKQSAEVIQAALKEKAEIEAAPGIADSQLAKIFARDADRAINVLEACVNSGFSGEDNIQAYIINVHAIKSALANVGEMELSETASKLEQAGRENNIDLLSSETRSFLLSLNKVAVEIRQKSAEDAAVEDTEDALLFLNEKLLIIREACGVFDKKKLKNAVNELLEKSWSQNSKKIIDSISDHLLHSEFDSIIGTVDDYFKSK